MSVALGRGLGSILEEVGQAYESEFGEGDTLQNREEGAEIVDIDIELVDPNPYQPRKEFDKERLRELSESIVRHGMLQPVVVVRSKDRYILVAGERRLRAHKLAKLETIRAVVADLDIDESRMRELALVENIQRENLNPVELAHAYKELIEIHKITHEELSHIVHKSRSQITNTLRILTLGEYAIEKLRSDRISQGHAKILVGLPEKEQKIMVDTIIGRKLSVRETEKIVQKSRGATGKREKKRYEMNKEQRAMLSSLIPLKHKVTKGAVEIRIDSEESYTTALEYLRRASLSQ